MLDRWSELEPAARPPARFHLRMEDLPRVPPARLEHSPEYGRVLGVDAHLHHSVAEDLAVPRVLALAARHYPVDGAVEPADPRAAGNLAHEPEQVGIVDQKQQELRALPRSMHSSVRFPRARAPRTHPRRRNAGLSPESGPRGSPEAGRRVSRSNAARNERSPRADPWTILEPPRSVEVIWIVALPPCLGPASAPLRVPAVDGAVWAQARPEPAGRYGWTLRPRSGSIARPRPSSYMARSSVLLQGRFLRRPYRTRRTRPVRSRRPPSTGEEVDDPQPPGLAIDRSDQLPERDIEDLPSNGSAM